MAFGVFDLQLIENREAGAEQDLRGRRGILFALLSFIEFDIAQEFTHHCLVGWANARQVLGIKVVASFDLLQASFQIAQLFPGLFISFRGQNLGHSNTSTTPLGRLFRLVANWRVAYSSKSASSAGGLRNQLRFVNCLARRRCNCSADSSIVW
jgi:hypothetical protein